MTDFTTVRSSSSLMARSAASARSSMLMAWIIAIPAQQIFTFGTHQLHAGRPFSACGLTKARDITTRRTVMTTRTIQRVTTVFLMAAAIAVVGLVGVRAHAQGPGGMHAGMMKRMISAALDEALDQAAVTAEQRTAIYASRDRVFAAFEANRPDRRAQRDQVLALFEGDRLDALVTEYLGRHEIDVTVAADGQRGLGLLRRGRFDVVLLDVMLPGADG